MKICLLCSQILENEKIGGFGSMTRNLAISLSKNKIDVVTIVPKRKGHKRAETMDGFKIIRLGKLELFNPSPGELTAREFLADCKILCIT